jgi:hypothetical protein
MKRLLPILLMLSACSATVPKAVSDAMEMDSGLPLSSVVVEGWTVEESCRPHLCHLHKRLAITAPDGESLIVVVAPDESTGKAVAVGMRAKGWDDRMMPGAVREMVEAFARPR